MVLKIGLEVCVDSPAGLAAAVSGGASRIELCASLALSGVTPSLGFMHLAARSGVPAYAMIRPHPDAYHYGAEDIAVMCADLDAARAAGLAGAVLGANLSDGRLDVETLRPLCEHALKLGLGLTLHRAFDLTPDPAEALEAAIELGFERVLTSGGARTAPEGMDTLAALVRQSQDRIRVMPGSGLTPSTLATVMRTTGAPEAHGSCGRKVVFQHLAPHLNTKSQTLGFTSASDRETCAETVAQMVAILGEIARERNS